MEKFAEKELKKSEYTPVIQNIPVTMKFIHLKILFQKFDHPFHSLKVAGE